MSEVILKRSSVAGKIPTVNDLVFGELAINYKDGKLYFKTAGDPNASPPVPPSIASFTSSLAGSVSSVVGLTGDISAQNIVSAISTSFKTINNQSIIGSGNLIVSGMYNADGGFPDTIYGGTVPLDGGGV
jgi:hypothetical protein